MERITFRYKIIDIRDLDEQWLLNSPFYSDSILAILTKSGNRHETIRRILERIATIEEGKRRNSLQKLRILAGLRKLGDEIRKELRTMPILDDIMNHDLLGRPIRQRRKEGELTLLLRLLEKRFGRFLAGRKSV